MANTPAIRPKPKTGRAFAAVRLALGMSQRAVAQRLGVASGTLARYEASDEPLNEAWCSAWEGALRGAASERWNDVMRAGLALDDLPTESLGALLTRYKVGSMKFG